MQLKKQNRCSQLFYKRRSLTAPHVSKLSSSSSSSTLPTRFPVKTIRSLNFHCLSNIFQYVDFKDLMNYRLVCSFWKECVDFHLARRTHFAYGKIYNNLSPTSNYGSLVADVCFESNQSMANNLFSMFSCEKCLSLNDKILSNTNINDNNDKDEYQESKSSGLSSSENLSSSSSLSGSQSSLTSDSSTSSEDSVISSDKANDNNHEWNAFESLCTDCQTLFKQMQISTTNRSSDDQYNQYIDVINLNVLERILSRLPRLTTLKYAEGYRYGFRQNCLDVSRVNLILRTFRHCPLLTNIDLSNCIGLLEADFYQLVKLYGSLLTSLNVSGCRIDETCLRIIVKGCHKLRYLNVANNFCRLQGGCLEWISERIETIVADYNQNVRVLDGLLQGKGRNIIELELNVGYCFNPSMPYKILGNHFQNLISLKIIFKSFGKRKQGIFGHLSNLKELECLYLIEEIDDFDSESSLDDHSVVEILSSCGLKLRELYLHASSSLFGGRSSLTDYSISQIDKLCPLLEVFSIKRASITDQSLDAISRLKNAYTVQLIDLEYISDEGIKRIMSSFRNVEEQHKQQLKQICGIDIDDIGKNGPKVEKLKRN